MMRSCPHSDALCHHGMTCPYTCATDAYDGEKRLIAVNSPSPPADAINTAEGEAWLAQKEPAGRLEQPAATSGQSDTTPQVEAGAAVASTPQAPQDVAALVSEARAWVEAASRYQDDGTLLWSVLGAGKHNVVRLADALAAALTQRELTSGLQKMQTTAPRELTDEEAERMARAIDPGAGWSFKYAPGEERLRAAYEERQKRALTTARAAYRAITEEPARTAPPHTPGQP